MKVTIFIQMLLSLVHSELIGIIQVNRHGARAPSNYPEVSASILNGCSNFQLTINGYKQNELLGQWIAERYMHYDYNLLSKSYNKDEFLFKSSPLERTIFSGAAFIKGMFPGSNIFPLFDNNTQTRTDNIPPLKNFKLREKQVQIPLNIMNPNNDKLFHSQHCKLNSGAIMSLKKSIEQMTFYNISLDEVIDAINDIKPQIVSVFKGKSDEDIYTFDFLASLTAFIIPIQYHTDNKYFNLSYETLSIIEKFQLQKMYGSRINQVESDNGKIINSALLDEISIYFEQFINNSKLKYVLFSGHDTTIVGILINLLSKEYLLNLIHNHRQYFDFLQPSFASSFIFELHKYLDIDNTDKYYVRILYNNEVIKQGFHHSLVYNDALNGIEYSSFKSHIQNRVNEDYKTIVCGKTSHTDTEHEQNQSILIDLEKKLNDYHITYLNVS